MYSPVVVNACLRSAKSTKKYVGRTRMVCKFSVPLLFTSVFYVLCLFLVWTVFLFFKCAAPAACVVLISHISHTINRCGSAQRARDQSANTEWEKKIAKTKKARQHTEAATEHVCIIYLFIRLIFRCWSLSFFIHDELWRSLVPFGSHCACSAMREHFTKDLLCERRLKR